MTKSTLCGLTSCIVLACWTTLYLPLIQPPNNYSFFKLYVTNAQNEILLEKYEGQWEIAGAKYVGEESVKQFIRSMANGIGIRIENIRLRGQFSFHYSDKPNPTLMHYFHAQCLDSTAIDISRYRWVDLDKAQRLIPFEDMNEIIRRMNQDDRVVWGGAFDIERNTDKGIRRATVREQLYQLSPPPSS